MLPVEKMQLHTPALEELAKVIKKGLAANFSSSEVKVTECPDLSQKPFCLASKGICGKARIADVGGVDNLRPIPRTDKQYSFETIAKLSELPDALLVGAGAGPFHKVGVNSEMMCNVKLGDASSNKTMVSKIDINEDKHKLQEEKSGEFGLMGNFLICEGKPGKVLEIRAANRVGEDNFVSCIHKTLRTEFGEKPVGLAGTFVLNTGQAKIHIMPDFSKTPLETTQQLDSWLKFFTFDAPLVHVGELVSADPQSMFLRQEHFHCYSEHGQGGHYHYDVTPDSASYLAYFSLAESLYRIDKPEVAKFSS